MISSKSSKKVAKTPHSYQIEALEMALEKNVILCLPTGSGKTFITIMVMNEYAELLNRPFSKGGKRAFFLVPTKVLVNQQADAIKADTSFIVGRFSGDSKDSFGAIIDSWTKTYWSDIFERFQVLVMTRKIFLDILGSGYIAPSSIATIIFDEAHRGAPNAKGKTTLDDYVTIMNTLREKGHSGIRIVGLTASLINNRWVSNNKMTDMISSIERIYDSSVFFPGAARGTKPKEIIWCYMERAGWDIDCQHIPNSLRRAASQIPVGKGNGKGGDDDDYVPAGILLENAAIPITPKQIKSSFDELARICLAFGPWSLSQGLKFILTSFARVCNQISHLKSSFIDIIELVVQTLQDFHQAIQIKLETYGEGKQLLAGITNKMIRLLQVLYAFHQKPSDEPMSAIIFVERRLDAMILSEWLNAVSQSIPEYSFMKTAFIVGSSSVAPFPFNSCLRSRYSSTIENFKSRKVNILVSTSVLEEGLDINHCNLIIRYDEAKTFRAYVQSKGRARSSQAYFVFFASEDKKIGVRSDINKFHLTEKLLPNYKKPIHSCDFSRLNVDQFLKTPEGAVLSYSDVKNRVIFYCDHLPADDYTSKIPKVKYEKIICPSGVEIKRYCCHLTLPKVSPLHKYHIFGRKLSNQQEAEMDAYYEAVKILWAYNELDGHFRPQTKEVLLAEMLKKYRIDRSELKNWEIECKVTRKRWIEEKAENGNKQEAPELPPKPGTHKKRRPYPQIYSNVLVGYSVKDSPCWLYKVTLTTLTPNGQSNHFGSLGLIAYNPLPLDEFSDKMSIYSTKDQVKVSIDLVKTFHLKESEVEDIKHFQEYIVSGCLKIGLDSDTYNSKIFFEPSIAPYHLLFTFLTNENTIDFSILKETYKRRSIVPADYPNLPGALISKNYGTWKGRLSLVQKVDYQLSPKSSFPKVEFNTFADYYQSKYQVPTINGNQPLLECYAAPTVTYFPSQPNKLMKKIFKEPKCEHLIPELCQYEYFSGHLLDIAYTIPAILTVLNRCLIACEIRKRLCSEIGYGTSEIPDNITVTYNRERFTNFVPLNVTIPKIDRSTKPVDLSYVNCTPYNEPSEEADSSMPGSNQLEIDSNLDDYIHDYDDDPDEYDSIYDYEEDLEEPMEENINPKPFNPEVLEMETSNGYNGCNSGSEVEIVPTEKTSIFNSKQPPIVESIGWNDTDIKITSDLDKIGRKFANQKFKLTNDLEDDEIEKLVTSSVPLDDFKLENDLIISTNSIYRDNSALYKYGLPIELIIEAMTTKKGNPFRNLERLEVIGDSFLKYIVSAFLFLKLSDLNEARITYLKMHLISNFNLLHLARSKGLAQHIYDKTFLPRENWLPPFYSSQHVQFTKQQISDKSIADMVESMIGAHLTCLGEDAAIKFLNWLGMPFTDNSDNPSSSSSSSSPHNKWLPSYNDVAPVDNQQEIDKIWMCSNLSKLEAKLGYVFKRKDLLIEAMTHPSWCKSHLNSYQRLEFIGDAILDYLITSYVFDHPNYQHLTPGDVTYIRQALVNNDYFATLSMVNDFPKFLFHSSATLYSAIVDFRQQLNNNNLLTDKKIKLGSFLLDNLETLDSDIIEPPKALGDIFESIAGAIYLDSGNSLATVWKIYSRFMGNELEFFCANVPKSPIVRLFETFPSSKFLKEKLDNPKQVKTRINLIVEGLSFTVNEDELAKEGMTRRKERMSLVLCALNTLVKDKNR